MIPTPFGAFLLEDKIGVGGMAEVYRARAMQGPLAGQRLAVKIIRSELVGDEAQLGRFRAEAEIGRLLDHPALVPASDTGEVDGRPYIAMQWIEGYDAAHLLKKAIQARQEIPLPLVSFIAISVAKGLDYLHSLTDQSGEPLSLVHCDVTPSNIFLTFDGEVRLGDFGVAQVGRPEPTDEAVGKTYYLSPQQIEGRALTPATDVHALSVGLYELTTGRRPFDGTSDGEIFHAILAGKAARARTIRRELSGPASDFITSAVNGRGGVLGKLFGRSKPLYPTAAHFLEAARALGPVGTAADLVEYARSVMRVGGVAT